MVAVCSALLAYSNYAPGPVLAQLAIFAAAGGAKGLGFSGRSNLNVSARRAVVVGRFAPVAAAAAAAAGWRLRLRCNLGAPGAPWTEAAFASVAGASFWLRGSKSRSLRTSRH